MAQRYISPFRYPGGKSWFVDSFFRWLNERNVRLLVEPFAGGASVSLSCLEADACEHIVLVEKDPRVSAVWKTILGPRSPEFAEKVRSFRASGASLERELKDPPPDSFTLAWHTLLRNRVSHGGITAPGSGVLKRGENGKGISSRWYPETLAGRIERIFALRQRINFVEGDAVTFLESVDRSSAWSGSIFFVAPPYPRAGRRLYDHGVLDHEKLFTLLRELPFPFLATYERGVRVFNLVEQCGFFCRTTGMLTRSHRKRRELLISNQPFYKRATQQIYA